MKKIGIFLIATLLFAACSKDDGLSDLFPGMSAKIDGEQWSTITRVTVLENNKFVITGTSATGKSLAITINGQTEGTYAVNLLSINKAVYKETVNTSTEDAFIAVSGEIVLTEVNTSDKKISGTFNFSVVRANPATTISITEGVFTNLKYTDTSE